MPGARRQPDGKTVKAVVLSHRYAYHEVSNDPTSPVVEVPYKEGTTSTQGVEVEVSQAEFDRGAAMTPPALALPKDAKRILSGASRVPNFDVLSDEELAQIVTARGGDPKDMTREELETFVASNTPTT